MLELTLCSMLTILPDYLYRRFYQGKEWGREITLYSVWYELRWGITTCIMLTVLLITIVFYNHPATTNVVSFFRTVPILPDTAGRVTEIYVNVTDQVKQGQKLFKLDSSKQEATLETAKRRVEEVDAAMEMAKSDVAAAKGQIQQAQGALQQAIDELRTKEELVARNAGVVAAREIEKLQVGVDARKGQVAAAEAALQAAETRISTLLPAEKASALAALDEAQIALDKTVVYAGVDGNLEQFVLKVGDFINPFMRPAGILIPSIGSRKRQLHAGFGQIEAQVLKVGMAAEAVCYSKPLAIIPLVITDLQDFIAAGQFRTGEQLVDLSQVRQPGTLLAFLEPMYEGGLDDVMQGSSCIVNAYSNNHERIQTEKNFFRRTYLHIVDTVALVHAIILRAQAIFMPFQTLVFGGGH
jgi:multidrug resistance efflux pump